MPQHAEVPSCPGWEVADLIQHVGWVQQFLARTARLSDGARQTSKGLEDVIAGMRGQGQRPADVLAWFIHGADDLVQALRGASPDTTVHTFYGTHGPALVARRAATETAIHRWDAEGAVGTPRAVPPALAADAIEEFLEVLVPLFFKYAKFAGTGETVRFESTDSDDGWLITTTADTTAWRRCGSETRGDVTARGSVSDLYLFCWGRAPADAFEVLGDQALLDRWQAAAAF